MGAIKWLRDIIKKYLMIQYNLDGLNMDGLFIVDDSNSFLRP